MKKVLVKIIIFVFGITVIILPFVCVFTYGTNLDYVYNKTYYAGLVDKYNRLESLKNKKKIVVIGCSGVAFGINSEVLMKYFPEYEVQNFGLYGDIGTKVMLDLSVDNINEGDIVIISPELSQQSLSLFFNPISFLKATEERTGLIYSLDESNITQVYGGYLDFLSQKKKMSKDAELVGVYQRKNLNKYGDISYFEEKDGQIISMRTSNIMPLRYDPNTLVKVSEDLLSDEFAAYLNNYASKIAKRNATILFDYAPINKMSFSSSNDDKQSFLRALNQKLSFPIVGNLNDHIISFEYFYDSNFHTNDSGAIYNTLLLVRDLKTYFGDYSEVEDFPEKPKNAGDIYNETEEDIHNSQFFVFETVEDGYVLSGLSDLGKEKASIRIPGFYKGARVLRLKKFNSINNIESVIIPEIQTLIDDGFFSSFLNIKEIHILEKNPNNISVAFDLLKDTNPIKIYVPKKSFESYANDYYWSLYSGIMEGE